MSLNRSQRRHINLQGKAKVQTCFTLFCCQRCLYNCCYRFTYIYIYIDLLSENKNQGQQFKFAFLISKKDISMLLSGVFVRSSQRIEEQ